MKKYDAVYIFVGIAKDDALNASLEKALAEVARVGGNVLSTASLGLRQFARPMSKTDKGVYVQVRMLVNRDALVEDVFRVQILAVDECREAKIAAERAERAERQAKKEAAAATVQEA